MLMAMSNAEKWLSHTKFFKNGRRAQSQAFLKNGRRALTLDILKQVAQRATIAHLSPMCQG